MDDDDGEGDVGPPLPASSSPVVLRGGGEPDHYLSDDTGSVFSGSASVSSTDFLFDDGGDGAGEPGEEGEGDEEDDGGGGGGNASDGTDDLLLDMDDDELCALDNVMEEAGINIGDLHREQLRGIINGTWTVTEVASALRAEKALTKKQKRRRQHGQPVVAAAAAAVAAPAPRARSHGSKEPASSPQVDEAATPEGSPLPPSTVLATSAASPPPLPSSVRAAAFLIGGAGNGGGGAGAVGMPHSRGEEDRMVEVGVEASASPARLLLRSGGGGAQQQRAPDTPGPGASLPSQLPPYASSALE